MHISIRNGPIYFRQLTRENPRCCEQKLSAPLTDVGLFRQFSFAQPSDMFAKKKTTFKLLVAGLLYCTVTLKGMFQPAPALELHYCGRSALESL
jgi:hypothetical protein